MYLLQLEFSEGQHFQHSFRTISLNQVCPLALYCCSLRNLVIYASGFNSIHNPAALDVAHGSEGQALNDNLRTGTLVELFGFNCTDLNRRYSSREDNTILE